LSFPKAVSGFEAWSLPHSGGRDCLNAALIPVIDTEVPRQKHTIHSTSARPVTRRVLIAADNRDATEDLATLLRMDGHEVTVVRDGRDALAAFSAVQPEVAPLVIVAPQQVAPKKLLARQLPLVELEL
jgi:hypothetical protein